MTDSMREAERDRLDPNSDWSEALETSPWRLWLIAAGLFTAAAALLLYAFLTLVNPRGGWVIPIVCWILALLVGRKALRYGRISGGMRLALRDSGVFSEDRDETEDVLDRALAHHHRSTATQRRESSDPLTPAVEQDDVVRAVVELRRRWRFHLEPRHPRQPWPVDLKRK